MSFFEDLRSAPSHIINGEPVAGSGATFMSSINPYTGETLWSGCAATAADTDRAVQAARQAFPDWRSTPYEARKAVLLKFTALVRENEEELTDLVLVEAGKPLRDAKAEVAAVIARFQSCTEAYEARCAETSKEQDGAKLKTRYVPHGVMVVIGPFNCPLSMANGHIMPALLAGNTVVFKPSEHTPLCGVALADLWKQAGLPRGVLNSLSGGVSAGEQLASYPDINGALFVGGHKAGMSIFNAIKNSPDKIAVLDMGGNNPLIMHDVPPDAVAAASKAVIQSAFAGGGQGCTAARRLIVGPDAVATVEQIVADCRALKISDPGDTEEEPFYGPLITPIAARRAAERFAELVSAGATSLLEPTISGPGNTLMTPGIIDVTDCSDDRDEEILGPILKLYRYGGDISDAIHLANGTRFGLSAGIICSDPDIYRSVLREVRAAIVNWNRPLTGVDSFNPVGGVKHSGNMRPAGQMSCDHCAYPVLSHEADIQALKTLDLPGIG